MVFGFTNENSEKPSGIVEVLKVKVKVTQLRLTLCDPTDYTVHGILQARILEWVAFPFSSGPHSVRPLHHDPSVLGGPTWHDLVSMS